jgi:Phage integrase, N-terminal SAM-like domain
MKKTPIHTPQPAIRQPQNVPASGSGARATVTRPRAGARYSDPLDYAHPYDSMRRFAQLLALRFDMVRTRHSYYRDLRLIHQHYQCDPAALTEERLRDYILHVRTRRHWRPKTIRQTAAAARLFFVDLLQHGESPEG